MGDDATAGAGAHPPAEAASPASPTAPASPPPPPNAAAARNAALSGPTVGPAEPAARPGAAAADPGEAADPAEDGAAAPGGPAPTVLMRDVQAYLRQLAEVAQLAGRDSEVTAQASALVEAQRIAAWGLRTAVTLARERGLSWRELADLLNVSAATLHRQYRSGQALTAAPSVFPEPPLLTADVPAGPAASPPP
ncbi:MAG: hypothetical protein QOD41_2661, partial [Cryptosporangiaceae bacterium]|nr:hypothetical protein [Cryptosporangiaceae bacterium]